MPLVSLMGKYPWLTEPCHLAREVRPVLVCPVQEPADVAGLDARLVVESFLMTPFGQVILLLLVHLVVAHERLVGGLDALALPVGHGRHDTPHCPAESAGSSACPSN